MNLSEHFTLEELSESSTAVRLGIDNHAGMEIVTHLTVLAMNLESVRALLGGLLHINDAYRCEALEKVLAHGDYVAWCGRHAKQQGDASWQEYFEGKAHPKGYAADFTCSSFGTPLDIVKRIAASGIKFDQLIQEGTWVHISFAPEMRQEVLTAHFGANGASYTRGIS